MVGDWLNVQHVGKDELGCAVFGVFFQQLFKDLAGFRRVWVEEVLFLRPQRLSAVTAGAQRGVVGEMANQVEGVRIRLTFKRMSPLPS